MTLYFRIRALLTALSFGLRQNPFSVLCGSTYTSGASTLEPVTRLSARGLCSWTSLACSSICKGVRRLYSNGYFYNSGSSSRPLVATTDIRLIRRNVDLADKMQFSLGIDNKTEAVHLLMYAIAPDKCVKAWYAANENQRQGCYVAFCY